MDVKILSITKNPVETIYRAFRVCYSKDIPSEIKIPNFEKVISFIKDKIDKGHGSPLEHVNFTFSIEGVSRSLTHQLVRHRIASYSQQSQRYVKMNQFEYVIPPEIEKLPNIKAVYEQQMRFSQQAYDIFVNELIAKGRNEKQAIEDARYVFPNACCSNIIVTMNVRSLRNFYAERSCVGAQWEIRELANEMMKQIKEYVPFADYRAKKCQVTCHECYKVIKAD